MQISTFVIWQALETMLGTLGISASACNASNPPTLWIKREQWLLQLTKRVLKLFPQWISEAVPRVGQP